MFNGNRQITDTKSGLAFYDDVYKLAEQRANSTDDLEVIPELNNILLYQDENEMCEYCAIGPNDMKMIKSLSPWRLATLLKNVLVTMTIEGSRAFWNEFKWLSFGISGEVLECEQAVAQITTNYYYLRRMLKNEAAYKVKGEEWQRFITSIKCLPYASDLIF